MCGFRDVAIYFFFLVGKLYFLRFFNLTKSNFVVFLKSIFYGRAILLRLVSFDANCAILSATFLFTFEAGF